MRLDVGYVDMLIREIVTSLMYSDTFRAVK